MPSTSYYDALKAAWASTTVPSGVVGTTLTSTMTAAAKLDAINAWIKKSTVPIAMIVPTYAIYNVIVQSEFNALSAANQNAIRDILGLGVVDGSSGTAVRAVITSIFTSSMQTFANLVALSTGYDSPRMPWWQPSTASGGGGLSCPVNQADLSNAGLS